MQKSLDQKLASIHADPSGAADFILADAKDADMAAGMAATGKDPRTGKPRSLADYRDQMREIVRQGLVDIVLMSCSTSDLLTIRERVFDDSAVTPAVRANDTTDIHLQSGGTYARQPSRPFRSCTIEQIQSGKADPSAYERRLGADLGLYSITPNNDLDADHATLQAYKEFRLEAEAKGFRHFLEIFDPNACGGACPHDLGRFINDWVARTLAGVPAAGRPIFLKLAYHGPAALEQLVAYDPHLVVGIMGGASGTTHDAFKLLEDAKRHGARAALFGRKINHSEHQLTFVRFLHAIASGQVKADEAVRAYHGELQKLRIAPYRSLQDDLQLTTTMTTTSATTTPTRGSGDRSSTSLASSRESSPTTPPPTPPTAPTPAPSPARAPAPSAAPIKTDAKTRAVVKTAVIPQAAPQTVDFRNMSAAQKVELARARIKADLAKSSDGEGAAPARRRS